jgi:hypothetical protein
LELSSDLRFDEKVRDVVGPYIDPLDQAPVLRVDEKNKIQALDPDSTVTTYDQRTAGDTHL